VRQTGTGMMAAVAIMDFQRSISVAGFCQLTDELIPLSSKKMTNSRVTSVTIASTRLAISYFSKG
jgi:hypothetical protein